MPIGLPDRIGPDGRGPERAIQPLLGARQSSVFSVPPRAAIFAADFAAACEAALAASEPPRKVSKQLFMIAPKMREVDAVLRADQARAAHVYEVHPELAFWQLNGERALDEPKKVKGTCYGPGLSGMRGRRSRISRSLSSGLPKARPVGSIRATQIATSEIHNSPYTARAPRRPHAPRRSLASGRARPSCRCAGCPSRR